MNPVGPKKRAPHNSDGPTSPRRERRPRLTPIERRSLLLVVILFIVGILTRAIRHAQARPR